jgi:hypothetical protein
MPNDSQLLGKEQTLFLYKYKLHFCTPDDRNTLVDAVEVDEDMVVSAQADAVVLALVDEVVLDLVCQVY